MAAQYSPNVRDLALYFLDDSNKVSSCWVTEGIYTQSPCALDPVWKNADLYEPPVAGNAVCHVLNLSRLLAPGVAPVPVPSAPPPSAAAAAASSSAAAPKATPGAHDLVVIPSDAPDKAFLVPRAVYTDPAKCPRIGVHPDSADLDFMALNEGVVVANLPKSSSPSGWTCFLLSLLSLKSRALDSTADKHTHFAALKSNLQG